MAHQRYTFGFTGGAESSPREERFFPQNEADYERLARIAAAMACGMDGVNLFNIEYFSGA